MRPNARKNSDLIAQYHFIYEILHQYRLEPFGRDAFGVDDLTIKVEKADGDLLYRVGDNVGLENNGCLLGTKGSHDSLVGKQGEYLFAVDGDYQIINRVVWPRGRDAARGKPTIYGLHALWSVNLGDGMLSGYIGEKTKFLVWVTVQAWHQGTGNIENPFGKFCSRSVHVTVYGEPDEGFEKLREHSSVYENLFLNSSTLMRGVLDKDFDIITMGGQLAELCQFFQDEVYFNGMKDILDQGKFRGASGQFGAVNVMVAEMCGYDRVMLQDNRCWVSFQLRPEAKTMYVLGCGGTLPQIRCLTRSAIETWRSQDNRAGFKSDKNVSVM